MSDLVGAQSVVVLVDYRYNVVYVLMQLSDKLTIQQGENELRIIMP